MDYSKVREMEKKAEYSNVFINEISRDMDSLLKHSSSNVEVGLDNINKKIDLAKANGLNIGDLDKLLLHYRFIFLKRDIDNKILELSKHINIYSSNITQIEEEYNKFLQEEDLKEDSNEKYELKVEMDKLYCEVKKSKVKLKIIDYINSGGRSIYSLDLIAIELDELKSEGININDIEKLLFNS